MRSNILSRRSIEARAVRTRLCCIQTPHSGSASVDSQWRNKATLAPGKKKSAQRVAVQQPRIQLRIQLLLIVSASLLRYAQLRKRKGFTSRQFSMVLPVKYEFHDEHCLSRSKLYTASLAGSRAASVSSPAAQLATQVGADFMLQLCTTTSPGRLAANLGLRRRAGLQRASGPAGCDARTQICS